MGVHYIGTPLSRRRRVVIEAEIERHLQRVSLLIARLDRADAPFEDLEDDDPGGTFLDEGEAPSDDGRELLPTLPLYAPDQASGPINEAAAQREYQVREFGRTLSPGGWGWAAAGS